MLRRIHKFGDSSQFIDCWEEETRICIKSLLKKEKRQVLVDKALFEIACFIIESKDNFHDVIKSLRDLVGGKNEMQEICKELKIVLEDHLKKLGDENKLKEFHRKLL